jgi:hypothetical protein
VLVIYLAPLPRGFLFGLGTLARFRSRLAGLRLTKAFMRIENARLRRRIVDLVQEIAPEDDT